MFLYYMISRYTTKVVDFTWQERKHSSSRKLIVCKSSPINTCLSVNSLYIRRTSSQVRQAKYARKRYALKNKDNPLDEFTPSLKQIHVLTTRPNHRRIQIQGFIHSSYHRIYPYTQEHGREHNPNKGGCHTTFCTDRRNLEWWKYVTPPHWDLK